MRNWSKMFLIVFLNFSMMAFAGDTEPNNFELYRKGKIVQSIQRMNQELWKKQFPTRQLNRMLSRLNSAFETNMGISSDLYAKALDKIRKQNSADGLELDPDILYKEFQSIASGPVSIDQVESLIRVTDKTMKGNQRSLRFLVLKMVAHRIYLKTGDLKALFITGLAGHKRFVTGSQPLEQFVEICQVRSKNADCRKYGTRAQRMLAQAEQMQKAD